MTPFGVRMRELRRQHNRTQQQQATFLGVSKAYISALEIGSRGRPSGPLVDQICAWLGLIWKGLFRSSLGWSGRVWFCLDWHGHI